jgi:hypothetical protein
MHTGIVDVAILTGRTVECCPPSAPLLILMAMSWAWYEETIKIQNKNIEQLCIKVQCVLFQSKRKSPDEELSAAGRDPVRSWNQPIQLQSRTPSFPRFRALFRKRSMLAPCLIGGKEGMRSRQLGDMPCPSA